MLENVQTFISRLIDAVNLAKQPHEIVVEFPAGSPGEGTEAGRYLLQREALGAARYDWKPTERDVKLVAEVVDFTESHKADDLGSLVALLHGESGAAIFINAKKYDTASIFAPMNRTHPAHGGVSFFVARHPGWHRWAQPLVCGRSSVDVTHEQLADLLLDNAEDLAQPQVAQVIAAFRAARTVEYDGDFNTTGGIGVKVTFKAGSSQVQVPRAFEVKLPSYAGIWPEGEGPVQLARITVRVLPPTKEDAAPRFRLLWVNAAECEHAAAIALEAAVRNAAGEIPVYLGTFSATRYVLPTD